MKKLVTIVLVLFMAAFLTASVSSKDCWFMPTTMGHTASGMIVPIAGHEVCSTK